MEEYLKEQYGVIEDKYLNDESEIVDYFKDCGRDYLECGQGEYQDQASLICKISDKFYKVNIKAEIASARQDVGDRLYWVDYISEVTYKEISKPTPKDILKVSYRLNITEDKQFMLEHYMRVNGIEF